MKLTARMQGESIKETKGEKSFKHVEKYLRVTWRTLYSLFYSSPFSRSIYPHLYDSPCARGFSSGIQEGVISNQ